MTGRNSRTMKIHISVVLRIAALTVAPALLSVAPAGQTPETGSISGRVKLSRVRGAPLPSNVYSPRAVERHDTGPIPELRNVVVYLGNITYRGALPTSRQTIRQERESFVPRVLAITKGSTVDFPNA